MSSLSLSNILRGNFDECVLKLPFQRGALSLQLKFTQREISWKKFPHWTNGSDLNSKLSLKLFVAISSRDILQSLESRLNCVIINQCGFLFYGLPEMELCIVLHMINKASYLQNIYCHFQLCIPTTNVFNFFWYKIILKRGTNSLNLTVPKQTKKSRRLNRRIYILIAPNRFQIEIYILIEFKSNISIMISIIHLILTKTLKLSLVSSNCKAQRNATNLNLA